jgi:hypothetical protein
VLVIAVTYKSLERMREKHRILPIETAILAGECQKVLVAPAFVFHTGKAVVQTAAIEIPINHLLDLRSPESVLS